MKNTWVLGVTTALKVHLHKTACRQLSDMVGFFTHARQRLRGNRAVQKYRPTTLGCHSIFIVHWT